MRSVDPDICRLVNSGDERGWEMLFNSYYLSLVAYAFTFLKDSDKAEDTVQDFFLSLWDKRKNILLEPRSLTSYLFVSVKNASLNKLSRWHEFPDYENLYDFGGIYEEYETSREEAIAKVDALMKTLPPRTKEVLECVYFKGMKYREVATCLGISTATVNTLIVNALRKFRKEYGEDYFLCFYFLKKR